MRMLRSGVRILSRLLTAAQFAVMALLFVVRGAGRSHRVSSIARATIAWKIFRFAMLADAATLPTEQLYLINHVLQIPRDVPGNVAEFGCFKGRTSAVLSIACKATGRRLVIFDSFAGLPPTDYSVAEIVTQNPVSYAEGDYRGTLDEVRSNIAKYGAVEVCDFVPGFFDETLPQRSADQWVMIFEDADLPSSVRDVLRYAWPALRKGGTFFCHEARDPGVVALFFDREWWLRTHGEEPPQLVGSAIGLPLAAGLQYGGGALSFFGSYLAYAVRR
jgi:O-methyltransferase